MCAFVLPYVHVHLFNGRNQNGNQFANSDDDDDDEEKRGLLTLSPSLFYHHQYEWTPLRSPPNIPFQNPL